MALAGCGNEDATAADVRKAIAQGADCEEIFLIRNDMDPKDPDAAAVNRDLRRIGCFSSSSDRTD